MNWQLAAAVFGSVFLAELGDKTQLATVMFAASPGASRVVVFLAAAAALVLTSALGVLAGSLLGHLLNEKVLRWVAGTGFILVGAYTIWRG
ncbi:MAG: TMEM165/GDT1 family protein [Candidatus Lambdaproteobacteria bacterium]|nr:TMEM165/GDT1 family protein [Candidatus Lambdaproteobacteria bacterium]